jgi:hypothetical protein
MTNLSQHSGCIIQLDADHKSDTVWEKMSALVVCCVLYVLLAAVVRCEVSLKRKESSTFLRLTSLRDDEGLWTARFGEFEVRTFPYIII